MRKKKFNRNLEIKQNLSYTWRTCYQNSSVDLLATRAYPAV